MVYLKNDGAIFNIYANQYSVSDGWSASQRINISNDGATTRPQVEVDAAGNAIAVWEQDSTSSNSLKIIHSNRYTFGVGWGTAELIETEDLGTAILAKIAMDGAGNAIVVWLQNNGTRNSVRQNRYTISNDQWGTAEKVEAVTVEQRAPEVAVAPDGTSVISWLQFDSTLNFYNLAAKYTPANISPAILNTQLNTNVEPSEQKVAIDANGNASIVWLQIDSSNQVYGRHLAFDSTSWSAATFIESAVTGTFSTPELAVDPSGNVIVIWLQTDGSNKNIRTIRFSDFNQSWGTAELIKSSTDIIDSVNIANSGVNNNADFWRQRDASSPFDILNSRNTGKGGWRTPKLIPESAGSGAEKSQLGFDAKGNGIAVWTQGNPTIHDVTTRHFN